ncbi:hypothetical protein GZH46_02007, partial [Fragariocoptes setiger]
RGRGRGSGRGRGNGRGRGQGYRERGRDRGDEDNSTNGDDKSTCNYCKKAGHWVRDCPKLKAKNEASNSAATSSPNQQNTNLSSDREVFNKSSTEQARALVVTFVDEDQNNQSQWVADSGCSAHMTARKEWLHEYQEFTKKVEITVGNSDVILAHGIGKIETTVGVLHNVHYVPDISENLFSLSATVEREISFRSTGSPKRILFEDDGKVLFEAHAEKGVFVIDFELIYPNQTAFTAASLSEWHNRLGHNSIATIKRMAKDCVVDGLNIVETKAAPCESCAVGKIHRCGHPTRTSIKADKPGISINLDTVGPINPVSLGGSAYCALAKDEYSSYKFVRFVSSKVSIKNEVKSIISRSDFLADRGIEHVQSTPYTAQQNGFIEREVRTVTGTARTMLHKSGLPESLWAEALNTAVYILNRVMKRNATCTPYELWFGKRLDHAVILKPNHKQTTKFGQKGDKVVFVGYTDQFNTFRFYEPDNHSVVTSCDVKFLDATGLLNAEEDTTDLNDTITTYNTRTTNPIETLTYDCTIAQQSECDDGDLRNQEIYEIPSDLCGTTPSTSTAITLSSSVVPSHAPVQPGATVTKRPYNRRPVAPTDRVTRQQTRQDPNKAPHTSLLTTIDAIDDPCTFSEAMSRDDKNKLQDAMLAELDSLHRNQVWTLVDRPKNANVVTNKWVLKIKRRPDGSIDRYKARLVARGFSQQEGVDYHETFAPAAHMTSVRLLFAYAAAKQLVWEQFDVKTAFLHGDLEEEVFMEQPEGFVVDENKVCKLKRSLYGLKQAPRMWNIKFRSFLTQLKLIQSKYDNPLLIVAIYVDNGLIFAEQQETVNSIMLSLEEKFEINKVDASTYLGFQIYKTQDNSISLYQQSYIKSMLSKFNVSSANAIPSPITTSTYASVDSKKLDASTSAYAVNKLSRAVADPQLQHWSAAKRIFRYLCGAIHLCIRYTPTSEIPRLEAYCDADFAGDSSGKSTSGGVILFNSSPIHWLSRRQSMITLSSTETEYISICSVVQDTIWIKRLVMELGFIDDTLTILYCDNESAMREAAYSREHFENKVIDIKHVKSENQLADMFTKSTTIQKFQNNRDMLMKPLYFLAVICLVASLFQQQECFVFERTRPLIYIPTNHYVDAGIVQYQVDFTYTSPCTMIPLPLTYHEATKQTSVNNPVNTTSMAVPSNTVQRSAPYLQHPGTLPSPLLPLKNTVYMPTTDDVINMGKRSISYILSGVDGLITGISVTNLISTAYSLISSQSDHNKLKQMEAREEEIIRDFEKHFNITEELNIGLIESFNMLAKDVQEQKRQMLHIAELLPHLTW